MRKFHAAHFSAFALAALVILPAAARADSNSLVLINASTGPIANFTGKNVNVGMIEDDLPATNNLSLGNIPFMGNFSTAAVVTVGSHATEVAGIITSTNPAVPGVAPGSTLFAVQSADATSSTDADRTNLVSAAFFLVTNKQVQVINLSMRTAIPGTNTTGTDYGSRGLDGLIAQTGVTIVKAAGNLGRNGTNTITEPGAAFNIITVGAVNNALAGSQTNVAAYSSQGFLADGRSEPDIVAPGGSGSVASPTPPPVDNLILNTTNNPAAGGGPFNATTTNSAGTSFAAPHVVGVVARLDQVAQSLTGVFTNPATAAHAQDSRVIKAVLMNSATKLPGWNQQGTTTNGGVINVVHPLDPIQGSGLLNAGQSYLQLAAGQYDPTIRPGITMTATNPFVPLTGWDLDNVGTPSGLRSSVTNTYQLNQLVAGAVSLTLDWNRDIDTAANNFNVLGLANLDLSLWSSPNSAFTNVSLYAKSVSSVDNLQQLYFTNLPSAYYEVSVDFSNYVAGTGTTPLSVTYALAWNFTVPEPSTLLLAMMGLAMMLRLGRRRRP